MDAILELLRFNSKILESLKKDFYLLNINLAETNNHLKKLLSTKKEAQNE